jgi:hypothetical protein
MKQEQTENASATPSSPAEPLDRICSKRGIRAIAARDLPKEIICI